MFAYWRGEIPGGLLRPPGGLLRSSGRAHQGLEAHALRVQLQGSKGPGHGAD